MIRMTDIHPLTDFLRNYREHLKRMKKGGRPHVLTVNGKAELVIQDAASFERLMDHLDEVEAIAGIRHGLQDVDAGRTRGTKKVLDGMRRKLKIRGE